MKYILFMILATLLVLSGCGENLDGRDSYIKVPAIWVSSYSTGKVGALLIESHLSKSEVTGLSNPQGIAFDQDRGIVFWTDAGLNHIVRYDLRSREKVIIVKGLAIPQDLDFDPVERKIYWCDLSLQTISRCDEWGGSVETLLTSVDPMGITIDPINRHFFYTHVGSFKIHRCNLDGTGQIDIITGPVVPHAITYHSGQEKIYWNNRGTNELYRSNRDGTLQDMLLNFGAVSPRGIALDEKNGYIYYTLDNGEIRRCKMDGSQDILITATGELLPFLDYGYVLFEQSNQLNLPEFPPINF